MVLNSVKLEDLRATVEARTPSVRQPACVAHRGASAGAPENTLAAVRAAIAQGSDMVELDVQRTKDGALVVLHDTTLVRTTDVRQVFGNRRAPWRISDFRLDEVRQLDAGGWKSPTFEGERVPTLREAIDVLQTARTALLLELKAPTLYPGIVADIAAELNSGISRDGASSYVHPVVVESFDAPAVRELKTLAPAVTAGLLGRPHPSKLSQVAQWADQVNPPHRAVGRSYVAAVHEAGLECLLWTINTRSAMQRAMDLDVDGVITDRPLLLRSVFASEGFEASSPLSPCRT